MNLLFDFGATHIKSAAVRRGESTLTDRRGSDGGARSHGAQVPAAYFADVFRRHIDAHLSETDEPIDAIWIASEMHGFLLIGANGEALTPYVSWRANLGDDLPSAVDAETVFAITGVRLRAGLPVLNLGALTRDGNLPLGGRLGAIPEWLVAALGTWNGTSNLTLAASTALVDIRTRTWSPELSRAFAHAVAFPTISDDLAQPLGSIVCGGRSVPIFGGIGDLQAALVALDLERETLSLNLGTGSQVSRVMAEPECAGAELRPFFDGAYLRTQTHIPGGRSLAAFADLFDEIAHRSGGTINSFWNVAADLSVDEVLHSSITADLAIFDGAWGYAGGGSVTGLREGHMAMRNFVAGICKGWLTQYPAAARLVDPSSETRDIVLSGGLPRRLRWVTPAVKRLFGRPARLADVETDETLHGLLSLARHYSRH